MTNPTSSSFKFFNAQAPVPAHRHTNPDGSQGGWVANTAHVDRTATISEHAQVFGAAKVRENACVLDNAAVFGQACVGLNALILEDARVFDQALVTGSATVRGRSCIEGNAWVKGRALVEGGAYVYGHAEVSGCVRLTGATVNGDAKLTGDLTLGNRDVATSAPRRRGKTFVVEKGLDIVAAAQRPVKDTDVHKAAVEVTQPPVKRDGDAKRVSVDIGTALVESTALVGGGAYVDGNAEVFVYQQQVVQFLDGPHMAVRHKNPDGTPGGWVSVGSIVDSTAKVAWHAKVSGASKVLGTARLEDRAQICSGSSIQENACVAEDAILEGTVISGCASVSGYAVVKLSTVCMRALVTDYARVDNSHIKGHVRISGSAYVSENSCIGGSVHVLHCHQVSRSALGRSEILGGREKTDGMTSHTLSIRKS